MEQAKQHLVDFDDVEENELSNRKVWKKHYMDMLNYVASNADEKKMKEMVKIFIEEEIKPLERQKNVTVMKWYKAQQGRENESKTPKNIEIMVKKWIER